LGKFTLYSKLNGETNYTEEGSCQIQENISGNWFGIVCTFTPLRSQLFHFDNFEVKQLSNEENPVDQNLPQYGEILISEIMAHPADDNPEYVEFYNASDNVFQLNNCVFYYGDRAYQLPQGEIAPKSYFILCKNSDVDFFGNDVSVFGVNSFPTLANTGKLLMLENSSGNLISWFEYSDTMYGSSEKKDGGWSLECKDFANVSNTADNWSASTDESRGTPGKANAIRCDNPDNQPLFIESILPSGNQTIEILFSKPMSHLSLLDEASYQTENDEYTIKQLSTNYPQCTKLTVQFETYPAPGEFFNLIAADLTDLSGNYLGEDNPIVIGEGHSANASDMLINELLFNPPTGGNEYVELVNCSDKVLDLRFLSITSRKPADGSLNKAYPLSKLPKFLYPQEYLVITKQKELVTSFFTCDENALFVELENMPSLANTSGCITLLNNQSEGIVDEFYYNESLHSSNISKKKGVALERISLKRPTNEASNWTSANSLSGHGTPGTVNSPYQGETSINHPNTNSITIEYPSPGEDTYIIKYQLDRAGYNCHLIIYDITGKK
jgi:hypothetical protein